MNAKQIARGLGWFSLALGAGELLAADSLSRRIGISSPNLLRLYGAREIACGVGILRQPRRRLGTWLRRRVLGDLLDLATLVFGLARGHSGRTTPAIATTAVAGVTALDVWCATQLV